MQKLGALYLHRQTDPEEIEIIRPVTQRENSATYMRIAIIIAAQKEAM